MNAVWTLAFRYFSSRKTRTVLTTLAVVLGVMTIFGLNALLPSMKNAFLRNLTTSSARVDLTVAAVGSGTFSQDRLDTVRTVDGIAAVAGSLHQTVLIPAALLDPQIPTADRLGAITVVGLEPETAQAVRSYPLTQGRFLQSGDGDSAVLPASVADRLRLKPGDSFKLPARDGVREFTLVGTTSMLAIPGSEEMYVPLSAAQDLLNHPGEINVIEALYTTNADRAAVQKTVEDRLGPTYKVGGLENGSQLLASIELGQIMFGLFGFIALVMGSFVIFNTFRTIVAERRHELGLLRAVGASRRMVIGLILAESLFQGIIGTALGLLLGYLFAAGSLALVAPMFQSMLHLTLGGPAIEPGNLIASIALGVGVTLLGGLSPAFSAARVTPLEALREPEQAAAEKIAARGAITGAVLLVLAAVALLTRNIALAGMGVLLFLIGLILIAPLLIRPISHGVGRLFALAFAGEGQVAQAHLVRRASRAAITASSVMIGIAILVAMGGFISTIEVGFTTYLRKSLGSDLLIMPTSMVLGGGNVGADSDLIRQVREVSGVADATSLRLGMSETKGTQVQLIGLDPATYASMVGLDIARGDEKTVYDALASGRNLIANGIFAAKNNIKVGDTLTMASPEGNLEYTVAAVGNDYLNAKLTTAYISQANLEKDFHQTTDLLILINLKPGADRAAVTGDLRLIAQNYPAFSLLDAIDFRNTQMELFKGAIVMVYLIMALLALPGLLAMANTLVIGVMERTREFGMLRAVGSTRTQVRRMVLFESLLLASAGTAFGLLGGLYLGWVLVEGMGVAGFNMPYRFPSAALLVGLAVGLIFGVIAALTPARRAARLDIVEALHYE